MNTKAETAEAPRRILMIKGFSAGIGDLLRSSAAWRALRNKFPQAELHLLFFTKDPGYISETIIERHHLLNGFYVLDKRTRGPGGWAHFLQGIARVVESVKPDLVIDFEPHGLRTSIVCLWVRLKYGLRTVGINQVPLRGAFYTLAAQSTKRFARERGLGLRPDYTYRDFVVLTPLGIERNGIPIEMEELPEGRQYREGLRQRLGIPEDAAILGVNIGCGTPGALCRRPDLNLLSLVVGGLQERYGFTALLTGAPFEKPTNDEFVTLHKKRFLHPVHDLSGVSILELTGLIKACNLFVTSDSGPYHIAVGLKVPTICVFNFDYPEAYHFDPWVRCMLMRSEDDVKMILKEADGLMETIPGKNSH